MHSLLFMLAAVWIRNEFSFVLVRQYIRNTIQYKVTYIHTCFRQTTCLFIILTNRPEHLEISIRSRWQVDHVFRWDHEIPHRITTGHLLHHILLGLSGPGLLDPDHASSFSPHGVGVGCCCCYNSILDYVLVSVVVCLQYFVVPMDDTRNTYSVARRSVGWLD